MFSIELWYDQEITRPYFTFHRTETEERAAYFGYTHALRILFLWYELIIIKNYKPKRKKA